MKRLVILSLLLIWTSCSQNTERQTVLRIGFLSNLTHAQALLAKERGDFEKSFPELKIEWVILNHSSLIIEGLFAGELDLAYLGPNPAANAFFRSDGEALQVIAGSSLGGVSFLRDQNFLFNGYDSLRGKKIAVPNFGGTQDVSLRTFLASQDLRDKSQGGDVEIYNIRPADQISLFLNHHLDAAWLPEPWVTVLENKLGTKIIFHEESLWKDQKFPTTLLVARKAFLKEHRDWVARILLVHQSLSKLLEENKAEQAKVLQGALKKNLGTQMPEAWILQALQRMQFSDTLDKEKVMQQIKNATSIHYLGSSKNFSWDALFYQGDFNKEAAL